MNNLIFRGLAIGRGLLTTITCCDCGRTLTLQAQSSIRAGLQAAGWTMTRRGYRCGVCSLRTHERNAYRRRGIR